MQENKSSISIEEFLDQSKAKKGNEAIFTVVDKNTGHCFENNIYDDCWKVGSGESSNDYVRISIINQTILSFNEQEIVRELLSSLASNGRHVIGTIYAIMKIPLTSIDMDGAILALNSDASNAYKASIKCFFSALALHYPNKYKEIKEALKKYPVRSKQQSNAWDIRTGALSKYEMTDLATKLNEWAPIILDSNRFKEWHSNCGTGSGSITYIGKLNQFIGTRMALNFHLRPEQTRIVKWGHFKNSFSDSDPFLFDGEGCFYPFYLKQDDDGPTRLVADPFPVSLELAQELKIYFDMYFDWLKTSIQNSSFDMSNDEIVNLMPELPLIINPKLLEEAKKHTTKDSFIESVRNIAWLMSKSYNLNLLSLTVSMLKPESDRVTMSEYTVNSRRVRHYTATVQSSAGIPAEQIAISLTHSSLDAVKKNYIDIPADVQALMDNNRTDSAFLVAAASGEFAEKLKNRVSSSIAENEAVIEDLEAGNLGKSASLPMCKGCSKTKPISCYGCHNFHPIATGNHRYYLGIVKDEYDAKRQAGYKGLQLAMYEHQMNKIKITIYYCDLVLKTLNNKDVEAEQ